MKYFRAGGDDHIAGRHVVVEHFIGCQAHEVLDAVTVEQDGADLPGLVEEKELRPTLFAHAQNIVVEDAVGNGDEAELLPFLGQRHVAVEVEIALAGVEADLTGVAGQIAQVVDFARLFVNQVAVGAGDWKQIFHSKNDFNIS